MPKQEGQKSKLLALLRIFETQTDENHLLNVPQLVRLLEQQGILCERKSVYSDIDALNALGYEIWLRRGRGGGYYMASRMFDLAELKLLVDAVQASRVVSSATSRRLIRKLEKLCSNYEGSQLQRQVYVDGRPKTDSKSLLYSVDALHEAINAGKMVEFHYKKVGRPEKRAISPWQMAWENGCYYLIAYQDEKEPVGIRHYRVDKMSGVKTGLVEPVQALCPDGVEFIASHPMAGRETSSVEHAAEVNFAPANFIITPTEKNTPAGIAWAKELAEVLGFKHICTLTVEEHDKMIGYVSQLCHAIAVSLMCANDNTSLCEYTGDSFRDLTRIARINDKMWAELFLWNKENLIAEIDQFDAALNTLRNALVSDDREKLEEMLRLSTQRRAAFDKKLP